MTKRTKEARLITCEADIAAGLDDLVALDPRLGPVVETAGMVPLRLRPGGLKGLCAIVTAQQVSKASADAIFGRLSDQADLDDALAVASLSDDAFRAAGLSRPKQRTILGLAEAAADGRLDFDRLSSASGPDAVAELMALKGIGIWTAQCYLLFCVGHADVFPGGDLALQAALAHAFALTERPKPKEADAIAAAWAPHRSVAARLLWAYYAATAWRDAVPL
ncbi:MAG: DNA-3-methyladenine glycosylase 2 family protein [Pseudomonadota bacterium]|nr:DNA-3-methyladenine glycosylase 2 family protein [Pseudomonadota bacterium]